MGDDRSRKLTPRSLLVLVALSLAACGGEAIVSVPASIRDSAGITIVDSRGSAPSTWRFPEAPQVEIGVLQGDPAYQLSGVVGAARLRDGRIAVADRVTKQIRFFGPDGSHLQTVGGPGQGPGEFRLLFSLDRLPGDTIVGMDWPVGSASWFDGSGRFLRTDQIGPFWPGLAGHLLPDASLLVDVYPLRSYGNELEGWAARGEENTFRPTGHLVRVSRDGSRHDTLFPIVGEEWFKNGKLREDFAMRPAPFAVTTAVAWNDTWIFVGETAGSEVRAYRYDGSLERLIRWRETRVPVTVADRDSVAEAVVAEIRQPSRQPYFEKWLDLVAFPAEKPAFHSLMTDEAGRLWVRTWAEAGAARDRWLVFGSDGALAAAVEVPAGLTLLEIGEDAALALWKDPLEVEYLRLYEIERG